MMNPGKQTDTAQDILNKLCIAHFVYYPFVFVFRNMYCTMLYRESRRAKVFYYYLYMICGYLLLRRQFGEAKRNGPNSH